MKPFYYLSDFPERKNAGQNFVAECPKCGKKHLSISKKTGAFHWSCCQLILIIPSTPDVTSTES